VAGVEVRQGQNIITYALPCLLGLKPQRTLVKRAVGKHHAIAALLGQDFPIPYGYRETSFCIQVYCGFTKKHFSPT
jgi:hypothetical protein